MVQIFFVTAVLFSVSILLIFIHDLFTQIDYFKIQAFEIKGNHQLTNEDILTQAKISKMDNLLDLNLSVVRKRLLAHPWIETAQITRNMPDGLTVEITEHHPEAILKIEDDFFIISNKGVIFKPLTDADPKNLPVITGISFSDIPVADFDASDRFKAVQNVLEMGRSAEALLPNREIKKISVDSEIGLTIYAFEPSLSIQIGYDNYPQKYKNLKHIADHLKDNKLHFQVSAIDLRDLDQIIVTPVNSKHPHQG